MTITKKTSVIINTKDRISRLRLVLKALELQVDESVEVIVVFDGCSRETLDEFDGIRLSYVPRKIISDKNIGYAAARNLGTSQAAGEIMILIDDDRIPAPDFVELHSKGHSENCVILGNRMDVNFSEEEINRLYFSDAVVKDFQNSIVKQASRAFDSHDTFFRRFLFKNPMNPFLWIFFYTGNVSVEKKDMIKAGMFDENFLGWGIDDLEIGYRFQKEGIKIIRRADITNYHLTHAYDPVKRMHGASDNFKYFIKKYSSNYILKVILNMLNFAIHFRILIRKWQKKN